MGMDNVKMDRARIEAATLRLQRRAREIRESLDANNEAEARICAREAAEIAAGIAAMFEAAVSP